MKRESKIITYVERSGEENQLRIYLIDWIWYIFYCKDVIKFKYNKYKLKVKIFIINLFKSTIL